MTDTPPPQPPPPDAVDRFPPGRVDIDPDRAPQLRPLLAVAARLIRAGTGPNPAWHAQADRWLLALRQWQARGGPIE